MAHGTNGFRGTRAGAALGAPAYFSNAGASDPFPRIEVSYWCPSGHQIRMVFAALPAEQIPQWWDCPRCGRRATSTPGAEPPANPDEPFKSHLDYVKERRTPAEGEALLERVLNDLRRRRTPGPAAPGEGSDEGPGG
ncbi:RNA polymerase-binding protein RbpA [Paenarthrobacter sp. DKR-5]|uniref:RNA polymerase-binding protein RbpA n=1 Tax=Paenarthrobacter sp. DKR-5 TaxID=2835535 RepID=UPI001BDCD504|nr:RNA polymerase-binding protein RbpA [Paenarthrobacter sp. DKR-5]MBT1001860.1 RNA polymerase-binding protein RbpA [Paenarthrobacter sp. DKR-5]